MKELLFYREQILRRAGELIEELVEAASTLKEEDWSIVGGEENLTPHLALARLSARQTGMFSPAIQQLLDQRDGVLPNFMKNIGRIIGMVKLRVGGSCINPGLRLLA